MILKLLLAAVIALGAMDAHAATNLVWSCPTAGGAADSCSTATWNTAGAALACDTDACSWAAATWRERSTLPATRQTLTCINDVPVGSTAACGANYAGERWLAIGGPVTPPPPPVVDPPVQTGTGTALITWTNATQPAGVLLTGLNLWQAPAASGPWSSVATLAPTATSYTVNGLAVGTHYWYLTASAGSSVSVPSNIASKTILVDVPPPPPPPPPPPVKLSIKCTLAGQSPPYANGDERFTLRCPVSDLNRLDAVTVTRP